MTREIFPSQQQESDFALKLRLELLAQIVREVGQERFLEAVKQAISISRGRYDVTIARIRECAGLLYTPPISPAMQAWAQIMNIVRNHLKPAPEGGYRMERAYISRIRDGKQETAEIPVPELPMPARRALQAIGGWATLAETEPQYMPQRMRDFQAVYEP